MVGRAHDREVGALVTELEHPVDELAVHVDLGASRERSRACRRQPDRRRRRRRATRRSPRRPSRLAPARRSPTRGRTPSSAAPVAGRARSRPRSGRRSRRVAAARPCSATSAIGSPGSSQGTISKSGRGSTLGASRRATTRRASPRRGSTSIVSRSSGIASYPVRYGRSAPIESSTTSTSAARSIRSRTRAIRSE